MDQDPPELHDDLDWRSASHLHHRTEAGVQVAWVGPYVYLRASYSTDGTEPLKFTVQEWENFIDGVGQGEFSIDALNPK